MSNFEYLRNVTIGQYLPIESLLQKIDVRTRLLSVVILLAGLTFANKPAGLFLGCCILLAGYGIGHIPLSYALRGLLPPLPFLVFVAILQMFINQQPDTLPVLISLGPISLSGTDVWAGCALLIRFSAFILGISLITLTMSTSEITQAVEGILYPLTRIGLPTQDIVMILQVTVRFLPLLAQTAEQIAKAQASRGAQWGVAKGNIIMRARQIIPLLVPLFVTSLRRAENMALAMDARGFNCGMQRTPMSLVNFKRRDIAALFFFFFSAVAVVLL